MANYVKYTDYLSIVGQPYTTGIISSLNSFYGCEELYGDYIPEIKQDYKISPQREDFRQYKKKEE